MIDYKIFYEAPAPEEYNELRVKAGLSSKDLNASKTGLKNSILAVTLRFGEKLIGMGRIIGDGGNFYHIVDIAVDPAYQGQGLGKTIMTELTNYLDKNAPADSYVSLIADLPADQLYKKFGFDYTQPKSVGMYKRY
ncbi:GNAT family acetyltransferase [Heyndrickxia shackletonii]|uniref:GNAT family acetyltransferase n=1 Tax=Heyndrickxia shackletonii TaxID=157838 RepID=A0A0Q3TAS5_9BACI|nr:GNAT family N-acetyltransferase [Heyndrickxia shackletonii]KQL50657.1 GNAT family acetyltransferase [Heyndrickxia shackletonii]MBB2479935.1 GNAT family N-acetyltransferase [Bacillus sp. APMAM]NEY98021.1 GNAT family N-acetyltransferase [Heyndrickxia shackletonii]RTZ56626.1 GNAT family N-acetyltransferase [Bacillus sp. SAJ1]